MALSEEIRKLKELRDAGALTDAEFAQAKASVLTGAAPSPAPGTLRRSRAAGDAHDDALGRAANTWVKFQVIAGVVSLVIGIVFFFAFFLPKWREHDAKFGSEFPAVRSSVSHDSSTTGR